VARGVNTLGALRDIVHALRGWPTPLGAAIKSKHRRSMQGHHDKSRRYVRMAAPSGVGQPRSACTMSRSAPRVFTAPGHPPAVAMQRRGGR